jgi:DNA-binding response OmpR family regulator
MADTRKTTSRLPFVAKAGRILVGEDDATTRRLISFKLKREGFEVEAVENGEQVLGAAAASRPALIILDIMMPVKDGYSTLRMLKADEKLSSIPVLILSGKSADDDVVRCLNAGAADYVLKPFSPDELAVRVRRIILREPAKS